MVAKFSKFSKRKKSIIENTAAAVVFGFIFFGIVGFFLYQNITIGQKRAGLENQLATLQTKAIELSVQQEELQEGVANTQTEEYQEKLLREQGLYKKEGEQVITVLPPKETSGQAGSKAEQQRTWWKPWTW
ncbi:MAG TPA: hypothetical protein VGA53_03660 [Candidatus Paceibacterota bacterium]